MLKIIQQKIIKRLTTNHNFISLASYRKGTKICEVDPHAPKYN